MFLYGITLAPLEEELRAEAPKFMAPLYADNAIFGGPAERSARLMTHILERVMVRGYFPEPPKSLFICNSPPQEKTANQAF